MDCLGTDGLLLNQNIDAITAIFRAGTPQTYSLFCFSPPCLSNQFRLNRNPPLHLLSSFFPSPTIPPPLSNFAFPLDLCVMTWPDSNRRYTQDCLQRERERERGADVNVTLTGITHVTDTSGCTCTFSLSLVRTCAHTRTHTYAYTNTHPLTIT